MTVAKWGVTAGAGAGVVLSAAAVGAGRTAGRGGATAGRVGKAGWSVDAAAVAGREAEAGLLELLVTALGLRQVNIVISPLEPNVDTAQKSSQIIALCQFDITTLSRVGRVR